MLGIRRHDQPAPNVLAGKRTRENRAGNCEQQDEEANAHQLFRGILGRQGF